MLLDASLVRMLLVPATMELLGDKNWWLPAWLDRILPRLNVEGPAASPDPTKLDGGRNAEPSSVSPHVTDAGGQAAP